MGDEDRRRSLLDPEVLRRLFRQLETTDIDELEVNVGDARLFLRREPGKRTLVQVPPAESAPAGIPVPAPLTGVFYARSSPDQAPFVEPGALVEAGQVVALIETMKLFNEVTVDVTGEVLSIAVRDGDLVETGQPLMYVQPRGEGGAV